jgi:hypothetical protein
MTNYLLIVEHFLVRASSASPRAQAKCCDPSLRQNNPTGKSPKTLSSPSDKNIPLNPSGKSSL